MVTVPPLSSRGPATAAGWGGGRQEYLLHRRGSQRLRLSRRRCRLHDGERSVARGSQEATGGFCLGQSVPSVGLEGPSSKLGRRPVRFARGIQNSTVRTAD